MSGRQAKENGCLPPHDLTGKLIDACVCHDRCDDKAALDHRSSFFPRQVSSVASSTVRYKGAITTSS